MGNKSKKKTVSGSPQRTLMKHLLGHKLKVSPQPPEFTAVPWYPLTVRIANPPATITRNILREAIQSQLGFTSAYVFDVRLQSVKLWGALVSPSGSSFLNPTTLAIVDPVRTPATEILEVLTDYPDQVNRARVGYQYSIAQRNVVVRLENAVELYRCQGVGAGAIMYVHLFWRTPNIIVQSSEPGFEEIPFSPWRAQQQFY